MLLVASALKDYAIGASDGRIGTVSDVLFDDLSWKIRWLVADTGGWLTGRKVLIHPSAISQVDHACKELVASLTKVQVKNSPNISLDQPVSRRMEKGLHDYYGWSSMWGNSYFAADPYTSPLASPLAADTPEAREMGDAISDENRPDPHLRSAAFVTGYRVHAIDSDIGHLDDFLVDDTNWDIRYLIIDTRNWWSGKQVLMSPCTVIGIDWPSSKIRLGVTRGQVESSPCWDPKDIINSAFEDRLHRHYGSPDHGDRVA